MWGSAVQVCTGLLFWRCLMQLSAFTDIRSLFWLRIKKASDEIRSSLVAVRNEEAMPDAIIGQKKREEGGIAQLARASALQAEGRRFDSDYLHFEKRLCRVLQGRFLFISINYENLR